MSFENMGNPVPYEQRQTAYDFLNGIQIESPMTLIDSVSRSIEKDKPYEAMKTMSGSLDLTGSYRLLAILLTH